MIDKSKSNLNIKRRKQTIKKKRSVISSRRKENDLKISHANIIFGLDNGATGTISCIIKYPDEKYKIYFDNNLIFVSKIYTMEDVETKSYAQKLKDIVENWN